MKRISEAEERVRALTNHGGMYERCFASRRDDWNQLCVAMDTLGDSAAALTHFESYGFGAGVDERYIRLYGTLQAIILQQDAIKAIYEIYLGSKPAIDEESAWKRLRRLRNLAVGHPLDAHGKAEQGKLRVFVSRVTISDSGFQILICQENEPDLLVETVDFSGYYESYKEEALSLLRVIEAKQKALAATL